MAAAPRAPRPQQPAAALGGGDPGADRGDLLAAIRLGAGGGQLRKASDRVLPEKEGSGGDPQNALLNEIRNGRQLKHVVKRMQSAKAVDSTTLGGLSVAAILQRRAALQADSETDEDDDDDWND